MLLEALDEFDAVESTPLKLCRSSLQNNQDGIRSAIGGGSRVDFDENVIRTVSNVPKIEGVREELRDGHHQQGGRSVFPQNKIQEEEEEKDSVAMNVRATIFRHSMYFSMANRFELMGGGAGGAVNREPVQDKMEEKHSSENIPNKHSEAGYLESIIHQEKIPNNSS